MIVDVLKLLKSMIAHMVAAFLDSEETAQHPCKKAECTQNEHFIQKDNGKYPGSPLEVAVGDRKDS